MQQLPSRGNGQRQRQLFAVALAAAWALLNVGSGAIAAQRLSRYTVVIQGAKFEPEVVSVARGDEVVWINKDPYPHTVTAPGEFDSHEIIAGASWRYVARKVGEFPYACTLHPNMKGMLKVERSAPPRGLH